MIEIWNGLEGGGEERVQSCSFVLNFLPQRLFEDFLSFPSVPWPFHAAFSSNVFFVNYSNFSSFTHSCLLPPLSSSLTVSLFCSYARSLYCFPNVFVLQFKTSFLSFPSPHWNILTSLQCLFPSISVLSLVKSDRGFVAIPHNQDQTVDISNLFDP